jgi:ketopantoate reductase
MARDLEEGRRLEVDALSGAVVRRGTKHGIPTPVHQAIVACLPRHQPSASTMQGTQARSAIRA